MVLCGDKAATWPVVTITQFQLPHLLTEKAKEIAFPFLLMEGSGFLLLFTSEGKEQRKEKRCYSNDKAPEGQDSPHRGVDSLPLRLYLSLKDGT